ncbi:MAG TPA: cob(I)yrinic acid a,c-diamide adenosyltransferase [Thermoguttaceae bacterium]|jgi:cob(I)alamin adenosyltransferase|nr:cob(I)yrinic acid a,c-diamide adenosyltransferase [Thermoguttaceae bacterium]
MGGYVHVYTGDGKGKTTAALGLALRAAGAGWRVFIGQFAKGRDTSELRALARLSDLITVCQFGRAGWIRPTPTAEDIAAAREGLARCREAIASGQYRLVILDEANLGPMLRLFSLEDLLDLLDARPDGVELVLTGRYAHPAVLERADVVTEMRELKHYYRQGVLARTGIEM